jgi:hypothetical protein
MHARIAARRPGSAQKPESPGEAAGAAPASDAGAPLPAEVRVKMERSFKADFSDIRIHEGPESAALGAQAYTRGTDIHFAPGTYTPGTPAGDQMIAHELAHVVQQREGRVPGPAEPGSEAAPTP